MFVLLWVECVLRFVCLPVADGRVRSSFLYRHPIDEFFFDLSDEFPLDNVVNDFRLEYSDNAFAMYGVASERQDKPGRRVKGQKITSVESDVVAEYLSLKVYRAAHRGRRMARKRSGNADPCPASSELILQHPP